MPERAVVERVIARVHDVWKGYVHLEATRWERKHYEAARSFQESIGKMTGFDIVIGLLWKRIGSPLPPDLYRRADGSAYESGTVFELESAIACSEQRGTPAVYLFRKTAPITYTAEGVDEERRQFDALSTWWNRTFRDEKGHFRRGYQEFAAEEALEQNIEALLETYLRERSFIPSGPAWNIESKGSPYPGLVAYDSAYSDVFFGRSLAADAAMEELLAAAGRDMPVLFLVGPSGSGKSSLARAGLASRFVGDRIRGVDFWRTLLIEPSDDPFAGLAQRLYAAVLPELATSPQATPEAFARLARGSPESAVSLVKWGLDRAAEPLARESGNGRKPAGRLLVVLDQLETALDGAHRQALGRMLRALVEDEAAWLIATLRSDRYADLQLDADLFALRRRGAMFDLPPPGPSEIADIIKGPARAADLIFEERDGESLAKVINAAVRGADALPLLQMTLKRLFDTREGRMLVFSAYGAMAGLEGAIAAHAEAVFATVSPAGQAALDALLRSLVADIDDDGRLTITTPGKASLAADAALRELVDRLIEARLLVTVDASVRVAHEALLRRWQRATASPALQPEAIRLRRQIEPNFSLWKRTGLDADLLQPGTTVLAAADAATRAHPGVFPPELEAYVRQSVGAAETKAAAKAQRARRIVYGALGAAAIFAGVAALAFTGYAQAQRNLKLALLTKAEQFLLQERPNRTLVAAAAAATSNALLNIVRHLGASQADADRDVRARTMADIAARASLAPVRALKLADEPRSVAFSGDGKRFAVGDLGGGVLVAAVDGSAQVQLRGHTGSVRSVQFGPGDRWIATAGDDRSVRLWNTQSGEAKVLCGHHGRVTDVAFDPSGRYLASSSYDGHVIVWDANRGFAPTRHAGAADAWALAVAFSPDGTVLASSDQNGNLFLRSTAGWATRKIATDRKDLVSIAFSADGRRLATASIQGALDIWDARTGARLRQIDDYRDKLWKVRFSPDGRKLAAASWDGVVRVWNADTYRYAGSIEGHDHWVNDIAFSPDASLIVTASESGTVRLWRPGGIRSMFYAVRDEDRETLTGSYSPDGSRFVTGGRDGTARLYGVDDQGELKLRCRVTHGDWVVSTAFSGDGKQVVSAGTKDGKPDNAILVWSADDCRVAQRIDVGAAFVTRAVLRPDGQQIAWATRGGQLWLMDLGARPTRSRLPDRHVRDVLALDYSPDGRRLASGGSAAGEGAGGNVVVWDVERRVVQREFRGRLRRVTAVRFAPDGRRLASAGYDYEVMLWDPDGGDAPVARFPMRSAASGMLAFTPDGRRLAVGADGRYIAMWSLPGGERVFELAALVGVRGVFGFHPKRGDLAFDGENGLVRVLPAVLRKAPGASAPSFELQGTEIFFDRGGRGETAGAAAQTISSAAASCARP